MLPGDLLRQVRSLVREPGNVAVHYRDDSRGEADSHRATLYYGGLEVCALPVGDIPEDDVYEYECARCKTRARHPWVCKLGAPPPGFERRGAEFVREPTGQGHEIFARLMRRGAKTILRMVRGWRHPDTGRGMVREGA